jgi:hypothetical protein
MTDAAQSVPLEKAPAVWIAYAKDATIVITGLLNGNWPPAPRMRQEMIKLRPQSDQPPPPLVLSLWVAPAGAISKVEAQSSGNAQAYADLRTLLLGRSLGAPPKGMLLPMRLAVQLADKDTGAVTSEGAMPGASK